MFKVDRGVGGSYTLPATQHNIKHGAQNLVFHTAIENWSDWVDR